jgi:hypothetical protein
MAVVGEEIIALAGTGDRDLAVRGVIRLANGERLPLEQARDELVRRLQQRSDDYEATAGLTVVNAALAAVGWPAALTWEARTRRRAA